jgi:hypothetical protein
VVEFIWNNADEDGIWNGDAETQAAAFGVARGEADEMLDELCQRHRVEDVFPGTYAITRCPERDESAEEPK